MKVYLECNQCYSEQDPSKQCTATWLTVPLGDTPYYEGTCPKGHQVKSLVTTPRFELLFESGIHALIDGYYREAVSSFAVAIERCYEFLIRGHLAKRLFIPNEGNQTVLPEGFSDTWKVLSNQSERQLGAFHTLYLVEFSGAAPVLDSKFVNKYGLTLGVKSNDPVNFRNMIIHQGYIPNREQALNYGEAVNRYLFDLLASYAKQGRSSLLHNAWQVAVYSAGPFRMDYNAIRDTRTLIHTEYHFIGESFPHLVQKQHQSVEDYIEVLLARLRSRKLD